MQVLKSEVDAHVNSHFEDAVSKTDKTSTATPTPKPEDKPGFFSRMFGAKPDQTATATTDKPAEPAKPANIPTPSTSASIPHPSYAVPATTTGTLPSAYQHAPPPNYQQPNQIYQMPSVVYRTGPQPGYGYQYQPYPGTGVMMQPGQQPGGYMYYPGQSSNQNK